MTERAALGALAGQSRAKERPAARSGKRFWGLLLVLLGISVAGYLIIAGSAGIVPMRSSNRYERCP